jgi:hypothetical protein
MYNSVVKSIQYSRKGVAVKTETHEFRGQRRIPVPSFSAVKPCIPASYLLVYSTM